MAKKYGKWQISRSLSEGGQARTYLVYEDGKDDALENHFVLKLLKTNVHKQTGRARFAQEFEVSSLLSHPNICQVVDHDISGDSPYFVSKYYSGGSLANAKDTIKNLTLIQKLEFFLAICQGVACAHKNSPRIFHRDLKPENIFLRQPDFVPVIGDFGTCLKEHGDRHTFLDEKVGSMYYMAPELADGKADDVGAECDVYSLGKILYWLLSGGKIFDREKKYRLPGYDLSEGRLEPDYYLINDLLAKMIVEDPKMRLSDGAEVSKEVELLISRIIRKGHHIDIRTPQLCTYCGVGKYEIKQANDAELGIWQASITNGPMFSNVRIDEKPWMIMVCDYCAHVQFFRPDKSKNKSAWSSRWMESNRLK